ncbi:MAG: thiamine pyrophosphate-dependent dehydrogenase E1 component subunit alpha [Gemmatimonadales bacterium]
MKRFPAFDPPEYLSWVPDPELVRAYRDTVQREPARWSLVEALDRQQHLTLYARLLRARLHDIGLKRWVRQGVISKAWLGTGEEATTVGPVFALDPTRDYAAPMIRNQSACCDMGMPLADMFRAYLASANGPSGGRDVHVGSMVHHVIPPVSPVGVMVPVTMGVALAARMRGETGVVLNWIGDGSAKAGVAHEGLNFAAVRRVPAIYIIQNNQVALGTRLDQHHLASSFEDWPLSYGMAGWSFDGNNVLDAYAATRLAVDWCRRGEGPVMLIAETFRMGGHATHDEHEARETFPPALFESWGRRDPIGLYEEFLKGIGVTGGELEAVEARVAAEVDRAADEALADRDCLPAPESALEGVYAR